MWKRGVELSKRKGFTVVELLIILGILAILLTIGIPVVMGMIENSNKSADEVQANVITSAIETWVNDYENYKLKVESETDGFTEDIKTEQIERIIRQSYPTYFKNIEDITIWDLEEFELECLINGYYPQTADNLRLILTLYLDDNTYNTKSSESTFYYIPEEGRVIVNLLTVGRQDILTQINKGTDYKGVIYRLLPTGDVII